ncbi:MAG: glycosyltransferase family 2 protein [Roseomonas sp.]|nr:glycosyltransferase family 2 protein [Roseomonas sp.]MCA3329535.1 glycosyltransferase family 2 protein [Roseomonas sp.]MCA3333463.1 glycosyltransferase family 2 protein [Roseomonas sp.]MCA3348559.1 glycosyltransferase family 2 protein [Roseomonas sp.]MCA3354088.1 glycosyltransferase family 2 protein [Roseomonas sp.]
MVGLLIAKLRAVFRRHPKLERLILSLVAPLIPRLIPAINRLRGPAYAAWFARWQTSRPEDDAEIFQALGDDPPAFLIVVGAGALGETTRASLQHQVAIAWRAVEAPGAAAALKVFDSGFVLVLDQGETLERHALACFALAARRMPAARVLYADEDMRDASGAFCAPWFKAAFDPFRLLQQASLGHAIAFDVALIRDHGLVKLRGHALALAATRAAGADAVRHVPAVLLHRHPQSPSAPWRAATDPSALGAALAQTMPGAHLAATAQRPLQIIWPLPAQTPMVSVIIPTRDRAALLSVCLEGLFLRTDYPAMEVIVVDNGSTEPALHALLHRWSSEPRLRVLPSPGPFNYALLNNRAAAEARGDVLVLLNNDTEVLHPEWLREMASLAIRPDIGAVGAKLFFPSGRIQHAGVILGPRGVAGHDYLFAGGEDEGQQDDLLLLRQVSALTGACLAVRRDAYLAVGGLDEQRFRVAYNDVDFCLQLGAAGLRNVFTPHARLRHHESASRGSDFSSARFALWEAERDAMREKWGAALDDDPFFPPLLSFSAPARTPAEPPRRGAFCTSLAPSSA